MSELDPAPQVPRGLRSYLAAFLPPGAVDEAMADVLGEVSARTDEVELALFSAAHIQLHRRARISPEAEVHYLADELGLTPAQVTAIVGGSSADVQAWLAAARELLATAPVPDSGGVATPAAAAGSDHELRRRGLVAGLLALVVTVLVVLVLVAATAS